MRSERSFWVGLKWLSMLYVGAALSGCMAYQAASMIAGAAVSTVTAVGRAVSSAVTSTSMAVNRSVQQIPAAMMYGPGPSRRIVIPARQPTRARPAQRPTRTTSQARQASIKPTALKNSKSKTAVAPERAALLEVLPPELLDKLTKDQLILQSMVQTEALANQTNEVIFWELEGRSGTSYAEAESRMGDFTCRVIVETLKLEPASAENSASESQSDTAKPAEVQATEAKATACRTESVGWTLSF